MRRFVILSDYGGPKEDSEVLPFLRALFLDRRILSVPGLIRYPLASLLSRMRAGKARSIYREIGGSPVNRIVSSICRQLNDEQRAVRFVPGFQYIRPRLKEVAQVLAGSGSILVLPTFPHEAFSTYGSVRDTVSGMVGVQVSRPYATEPAFVDLVADHIRAHLADWPVADTAILCVAHSIPVSHVRRGDRYVEQVKQQVALLSRRLSPFRLDLAFQSPLGPVEWVGPFASDRLSDLVREGAQRVLVMPLSFTVDNSETLFDLDRALAAHAGTIGLSSYRRVPCLNEDEGFRRFLLAWAKHSLSQGGDEDREDRT